MSYIGQATDGISDSIYEFEEGDNIYLDTSAYARISAIDSLSADLLRLASFIYAADLSIHRLEREQHIRSIELRVPLVNFDIFERLKKPIEAALRVLSHDNWALSFERVEGTQPVRTSWTSPEAATLMFSGGLDSFAGAPYLLNKYDALTLVSHTNNNKSVSGAQNELFSVIEKLHGGMVDHLQIRIYGRKNRRDFPTSREDSQRTRSFLFVSLASIAARLYGSRQVVVMAENGQFSIHLPLSEARIGSFSTHTAHPEFLYRMQEIMRELFDCPDFSVSNPFCYLTKGEVVGYLPTAVYDDIHKSGSCWMGSRTNKTHCGICIPCLSRRIALESHGIHIDEYDRDLLNENIGALPESDTGKRNIVDLCQFISAFDGPGALVSEDELCMIYPDLVNPSINATEAISMYRRFAKESYAIFSNYPNVAAIL